MSSGTVHVVREKLLGSTVKDEISIQSSEKLNFNCIC